MLFLHAIAGRDRIYTCIAKVKKQTQTTTAEQPVRDRYETTSNISYISPAFNNAEGDHLNSIEWGWKSENGKLQPVISHQYPAPPSFLRIAL